MSRDEESNEELAGEAPTDAPGSGRWLRWFVPVTAAAAVVALTAGAAMALRGPSLEDGNTPWRGAGGGGERTGAVGTVTAGSEPAKKVTGPVEPTAPDAPVSMPGARSLLPTPPTDVVEGTSGAARPTPPQADPERTGHSEPPWPGDDRPMTGPWAETGPDGQRLTLHFYGTPATPKACGARYTATVREAPGQVRLRVHKHDLDGDAGGGSPVACPEIAKERTVTVELDRPLGDRSVYKMPEGREVPVRGR